jgi:hypothetical protein
MIITINDEGPLVKIIDNEIGEYTDDKTFIKLAAGWYKKNLAGSYVVNPILGKIYFYQSSFKETKDKNIKNIKNLKYLPALKEILSKSEAIIPSLPSHKRKDNIFMFYYVFATVQTKKIKQRLKVCIAEDNQGKKYYTLDIVP